MEFLFIFGRILFGSLFLMNGINHFKGSDAMTAYTASKGLSMPRTLVYFSGLMIILGGLGIILGFAIRWAVLLIVVFLAVISFKMHAFWKESDPQAKMMEMTQFTKNMALLGAALMMLSLLEPWPLSL